MKKFLLLLISFLIGITLFVWIFKMVGWPEIKNAFLVFTGWQGLAILILTFLMTLLGNWKWREILKGEDVKISFWELFRTYLAGFALMFLAPILIWGGETLRSYVLKRKNQTSFAKSMASVVIDRLLEWTVNLTVIFFGILFFLLTIGLPPIKLAIIFGGLFSFFTMGISLFYFKIFKKESLAKFFLKSFNLGRFNQINSILDTEREIFNFFKLKNIALWRGFCLSFLRALVMYLRTWSLIIFLGGNIGPLPALSILSFSYLAVMIPIPTALGSHEAIQTFAFNSLGLNLSSAAAFTMIIRGAEVILALIGIIILFKLGIDLLRNTLKL